MNKQLSASIRETIELLIGSPAECYRHEHALRLFWLQMWILFPSERKIRDAALLLAAARLLEAVGRRAAKKPASERGSASQLRKLLRRDDYCAIYDTYLAPTGGWTALAKTETRLTIDDKIDERRKSSLLVHELIDYRFRYMDHGGDSKNANITHGHVYRWWRGQHDQTKVTRESLRTRWKPNKASAVFVYASERFQVPFYPPPIAKRGFISALSAQRADKDRLLRYFGMCSYVAEKLHSTGSESESVVACFPPKQTLPRIRPQTAPISPQIVGDFIAQYRDLYNTYQTGPGDG